jgi:hypothetical protein
MVEERGDLPQAAVDTGACGGEVPADEKGVVTEKIPHATV